MLKSSLAFFSAVLLVAGTSAAQDFDAVEIQRTDLGGGVAMLAGAGGNIGLSSGPDGVVLITGGEDEHDAGLCSAEFVIVPPAEPATP